MDYDEGSSAEQMNGILFPQHAESPEVRAFAKTDLGGKPPVAFEAAATYRALAATWGAGSSRPPAHVRQDRAEAS